MIEKMVEKKNPVAVENKKLSLDQKGMVEGLAKKQLRILIVEDQSGPLEALEFAIETVMPKRFPDRKVECDRANCYEKAKKLIDENQYDIIFLDHRMPYFDQGDAERKDREKFCASLQNLGYGLIKWIREKNPKALIIGTSSLDEYELRDFEKPPYKTSKMFSEAGPALEKILDLVSLH